MHIIVGHHCNDDQGIIVGVMNAMSITIAEGDVVVLPLEVFYRPLVQVVDISERLLPRFLGIAVSGPAGLSREMGSTKDSPNPKWGLPFLQSVI